MISLNMVSGSSFLLQALKPVHLAPLAIVVGLLLMTIGKNQKKKEVGEI